MREGYVQYMNRRMRFGRKNIFTPRTEWRGSACEVDNVWNVPVESPSSKPLAEF
jgi:hypothetical protein